MTQPPKRLLESAEPGSPARTLLELGRMHAPVVYDVGAGAARFEAALAAPGAGANAAPLVQGVKLGKLCLLLSPVIVATAVLVTQPAPKPPPQPAAAHTVLVEVPAPIGVTPSPLPPEPIAPAGAGTSVVEAQPVSVEASQQTARAHAASRETRVSHASAGGVVQRAPSVSHETVARPRADFTAAEGGSARAAGAGDGRVTGSQRSAAEGGSARAVGAGDGRVTGSPRSAAASGRSIAAHAREERESRPAEPSVSHRVASDSGSATPVPRTTDSIGELEGLARARRLTRQDPHAAVELLERLARAHPRGYFVEEREALLVMALSQDGESRRASQLGAAFLRKYPASPLADSVRTVVDAEVAAKLCRAAPPATCNLGDGVVLPEELTVDVPGATIQYFALGAELPAGHYRLSYVDGCATFGGSPDDGFGVGWSVNGQATMPGLWGCYLAGADGTAFAVAPGTAGTFVGPSSADGVSGAYMTYAECVEANCDVPPLDFDFPGGKLGVARDGGGVGSVDDLGGEAEGGRSPTFRLSRMEGCL